MPITRPVTKTIISTTDWGFPVTDAINALQTAVAALQPTAWVNLTLINGWVPYDGNRPVQIRKVGDLCFLRGVMKGGTSPAAFAVVPAGYRPVATKDASWITNASGTPVVVTLDPGTFNLQFTSAVTNTYVYTEPCFWQWNGSAS